jgi:mono/diheme cytochrome c family protein
MKKEGLARFLVILFILIAVTIPFAGQWLFSRNKTNIIDLHARMPENGGWSIDRIDAVVGEPIHLRMTSDDVVHGIAIGKSDIPAVDIYPGEFVETTLVFGQPGRYTFYCTRWCGPNHWRMRGTIDVSGQGIPLQPDPQPLFVTLEIDIDSPPIAETIPSEQASAERGANYASLLPTYAIDRDTYLSNSPAFLWMRLRAEPVLSNLSDQDIWDSVAWIWQNQTTPEKLENGQRLYAENCAACHGETGKGDGVMVREYPVWDPGNQIINKTPIPLTGEGFVRPRDFSDPKNLLGTSPALLEGKIIRGGNGTGMPYWGPIFTTHQIEDLFSYLYNFAWGSTYKEMLD